MPSTSKCHTYSAWERLPEATRTNAWLCFKAALKQFFRKIRWPISPSPIFWIFKRVTNRERRDERKRYLFEKYRPDSSHGYKAIVWEIFRFSFHEHCTCTTKLTSGLEPLDISEIKPLCKTGLLKWYAFISSSGLWIFKIFESIFYQLLGAQFSVSPQIYILCRLRNQEGKKFLRNEANINYKEKHDYKADK